MGQHGEPEPEWDPAWPRAFVPGHLSQLAQDSFRPRLSMGQHEEPEWDPTWPRAFVPGHLSQPNLPRTAFLGLPASDTFPSPLALGQPRPPSMGVRMGTWPRAFVPGHLSQPNLPRTAFLGLPASDTFPSPLALGQLSGFCAPAPAHSFRPRTPFLGLPARAPQSNLRHSFRPRTPFPVQPAQDSFPRPPGPQLSFQDIFPSPTCI